MRRSGVSSPSSRRSPSRPADPSLYPLGVVTLSRSDVEHVAYLARLGLADDELARLEAQLNHILDQYRVLAQLDTDAIEPTAQTIELENILREDVPGPSLEVEEALGGAPERSGDHFVVSAVLGDGDDSPAGGEATRDGPVA